MTGRHRLLLIAVAAVLAAVAAATAAIVPPDDTAPPVTTAAERPADATDQRLPALDERVPLGARTLAATLRDTAVRLDAATDEWRRSGDLSADRPPVAVTRLATYNARIVAVLGAHRALARQVLIRLPRDVAHRAAPEVRALRDLAALHRISKRRPGPPPKIRLGRPEPAAELLRHYRDAERRFGVDRQVLAAVNYVESRFGRLRNESISGARGPMQFMPATWRAYGMGGDVRDPRDAIMGAANYLSASGGRHDVARALYSYNPSPLYVRTVRMYARRIASDPRGFLELYAREIAPA